MHLHPDEALMRPRSWFTFDERKWSAQSISTLPSGLAGPKAELLTYPQQLQTFSYESNFMAEWNSPHDSLQGLNRIIYLRHGWSDEFARKTDPKTASWCTRTGWITYLKILCISKRSITFLEFQRRDMIYYGVPNKTIINTEAPLSKICGWWLVSSYRLKLH